MERNVCYEKKLNKIIKTLFEENIVLVWLNCNLFLIT